MKTLFTSILLYTTAALFTGCMASKPMADISPAPKESYDTKYVEDKEVFISAVTMKGTKSNGNAFHGDTLAHSSMLSLQRAADYTLKKGDKYFSIYRPKKASQIDSNGPANIEAYEARCVIGDSPSTATDLFTGVSTEEIFCNTVLNNLALIEFVTYTEKPSHDAYDAAHVVEYMKSNGLYIKDEEIKTTVSYVGISSLAVGMYGYDRWRNYRDTDWAVEDKKESK